MGIRESGVVFPDHVLTTLREEALEDFLLNNPLPMVGLLGLLSEEQKIRVMGYSIQENLRGQ